MANFAIRLMRVATVVPLLQIATQAKAFSSQTTPQMRTFVSGLGSDSNPCTASSPCKTFNAALALTIAGSEAQLVPAA